jgi:hypothetical protein
MDIRNDWQVKIVQDDALLFKVAPDGTVTMRAVPRKHWETLLVENVVGGVADVSSAGTTRYFEAAQAYGT